MPKHAGPMRPTSEEGGAKKSMKARLGFRFGAALALLAGTALAVNGAVGLTAASAAPLHNGNNGAGSGSNKVTLCHAKPADTAKNGWVVITIDDSGTQGDNRLAAHANEHAADIIPAFTYSDGTQFPGKNLGDLSTFGYEGVTGQQVLDNDCAVPGEGTGSSTPPSTQPPSSTPPSHKQGTVTGKATCNANGTYTVNASAKGLVGKNNNPNGYYQGGVFVTNGVNTVYSQSQTDANGDATFPPFTFDAKGQSSVKFFVNSTTSSGGVDVAFTVDFAKCGGQTSTPPSSTPPSSPGKSSTPPVHHTTSPVTHSTPPSSTHSVVTPVSSNTPVLPGGAATSLAASSSDTAKALLELIAGLAIMGLAGLGLYRRVGTTR